MISQMTKEEAYARLDVAMAKPFKRLAMCNAIRAAYEDGLNASEKCQEASAPGSEPAGWLTMQEIKNDIAAMLALYKIETDIHFPAKLRKYVTSAWWRAYKLGLEARREPVAAPAPVAQPKALSSDEQQTFFERGYKEGLVRGYKQGVAKAKIATVNLFEDMVNELRNAVDQPR